MRELFNKKIKLREYFLVVNLVLIAIFSMFLFLFTNTDLVDAATSTVETITLQKNGGSGGTAQIYAYSGRNRVIQN